MAEPIVDALEVIDVDEQDRGRCAGPAVTLDGVAEAGRHVSPVEGAGERVRDGEIEESGLELADDRADDVDDDDGQGERGEEPEGDPLADVAMDHPGGHPEQHDAGRVGRTGREHEVAEQDQRVRPEGAVDALRAHRQQHAGGHGHEQQRKRDRRPPLLISSRSTCADRRRSAPATIRRAILSLEARIGCGPS